MFSTVVEDHTLFKKKMNQNSTSFASVEICHGYVCIFMKLFNTINIISYR